MKFSVKDSPVNVTKSAGFGHIYWKKTLMKNFIFCAVPTFRPREDILIINLIINLDS